MNIQEIRDHRIKAEQSIFLIIQEFKALTGLCICECTIKTVTVEKLQGQKDTFIKGVYLTTESI